MKRRCYQCKCLEEESTAQFVKRTRRDLCAKFYCKKCRRTAKKQQKNINPEIQEQIINFTIACHESVKESIEEDRKKYRKFNATEPAKKGRKRYSNTDNGSYSNSKKIYNHRMRKMKKRIRTPQLSYEERVAIGCFYRKCPEGYEIDHIIPLHNGGRHEFSNLQYLSKEEHKKKSARELSEKTKSKILQTTTFRTMPKAIVEIELVPEKRNRASKFKRMRRLIEK